MTLGTFLLSTLTAVLVLLHGTEGITMRGFGPGNVGFPLTNNSVYTVPPELNVWPLMLCSGKSTQETVQWLHLTGSSITTDAWAELSVYQHHDGQAHPGPNVGLYRGNGYTLTAYDEQEIICEVTSDGGAVVERLVVRVQLPRAPPAKPKLTDSGRILSANGTTLLPMDCIVDKHIAPYPSIAWFKDDTQLQPGQNVIMQTVSTQDLRLKLTITNFTPDTRGLYYCVAKNGLGETQSDSIYLDLEGFPSVYTTSETVYFTLGEDLTLRVSAAQYKSLHWSFIGTAMGVGGTLELGVGEYTLEDFNQTAVIHNATTQHEGYYMVQASSSEEMDPFCVGEDAVSVCAGRVVVLRAVAGGTVETVPTVSSVTSNQMAFLSTNTAVIACATVSGVLLGVIIAAACTFCIVAMRRRKLRSNDKPGQGTHPVAVANPYSTRKLPSVRASVISEDNLYQVVHQKGTRSRSRSKSPLAPSASARVGGEIPHYAEGFGDTLKGGPAKNLQQEGYMTMGSCAAMLGVPRDAPVSIKVIDSDADCN